MKNLILDKNSKKSLHLLTGINRGIKPSQVTKLAKSINKMGCIRPIVAAELSFIDGSKKKYIIDGQHLFHALMRNNMDFEYIEIKIKDLTELIEIIALLNASSMSWCLLDYIQAWGAVVADYKTLYKYYNTYDLELSTLGAILNGDNCGSGASIGVKFKNGSFRIRDEENALVIINQLTDVLKILPRMNRFENRYLCSEYVNFLRSNGSLYNHLHFLTKLQIQKEKFILATQEPGKLNEMFKKLSK